MNAQQIARHYATILVVAGVVFFFNLGVPRLWDRDEPRNAGCAAEMLARGDLVVPVFNGQLRVAKPVLLYWLMIGSYSVLGVNEFAARLPSAVLAMGTVLTTYHLGRRLFDPSAALWSAVVLATSLMFTVAARAATPDSTLIFFSTLGLAVFARGIFTNSLEARLPWRSALPLYGALGLAALAKGPVGVVLPMGVIGMFLLVARLPQREKAPSPASWQARVQRWLLTALCPFHPRNFAGACWQMRLGIAAATVLAVALPWYLWVSLRTDGQWLEGFLWNDNVRRFVEILEDHEGSILYYPGAILAGFFPWSVFALPLLIETALRLARRDQRAAGYLFCVCWVGVYVGIFSLARTKLPNYVTPCYPALALLAGVYIDRWLKGSLLSAAWWPQVSLGALAGVGCLLLVGLPLLVHHALPGEEWLGAIALVPIVGGIVALVLARRGNTRAAGIGMALAAILFQTLFFGMALVRVDSRQRISNLLAVADEQGPTPRLATFGCLESSWVYYWGRPIQEFQASGEMVPQTPLDSSAEGPRHIREFASGERAYIISTNALLPHLRPFLPAGTQVIAQEEYFLERETLVLLGPPPTQLARSVRAASR